MKYKYSPKRLRRWPRVAAIVLTVAVVSIVGSVLVARHIYNSNLRPLNSSSQRSVAITIVSGSSLKDISILLKKHGLIRSEWAFTQYVRNREASNDLKAGTYELSPRQSVPEIVAIITGGKISANLITILPGQRLDQIKKTFVNSGFSAKDVDRALNPALYKNHPALVDKPSGASLEGYLYPESFQKTGTPEDIIRQSLDEMQKRLTPDVRNAIQSQGLSVHQGIILASIAEKEADKPEDRSRIVQVFLSRIHLGMRLESDVTAFYGAAIAGQPLSVNYNSRYNTYFHGGLPPGPISNVSESSLNAVAHPAHTNYLYFLAGDDGTVYFAQTQVEHDDQIARYCKTLCAPPQ